VKQAADGWKVTEVWRGGPRVMRCKFTSPVLHEGHLYGLNEGKLECLDVASGEVKWTDERRSRKGEAYQHGQIILRGRQILVQTEFGELVLVAATPTAFEELARYPNALSARDSCWNQPALVDKRIYLRNAAEMACYELP
jgi:outer membrane protein assembly factor BamB